MSKSGYFWIGVFVLTAVLLGTTGLILFSSGAFESGVTVYTVLDEAVAGLSKGSLVKYRGVQVGHVEAVSFAYQTKGEGSGSESFQESGRFVVIRMKIDEDVFRDQDGKLHAPKKIVQVEVERGLHVRVATDGISPVAYMEFDYSDKKPKAASSGPVAPGESVAVSKIVGDEKPIWLGDVIFVPRTDSTVSRLTKKAEAIADSLANAKIDELALEVKAVVVQLKKTIQNVEDASVELPPLVKGAKELVEKVQPLATKLEKTAEMLPDTLRKVDKVAEGASTTIENVNKKVDTLAEKVTALLDAVQELVKSDLKPILASINLTAADLPEALKSLQATIKRVDRLIVAEQSEVNDVLGSVRTIASDAEELVGDIKSCPTRLLFGGPPPPRERKK